MSDGNSPSADQQEHLRLINALRESEFLRELASLLTSSLDLAHILHTLAKRTTEVCEVERCAVWLLEESQRQLQPAAYYLSTQRLDRKIIAEGDAAWRKSALPLDDPVIHRLLTSSDGMLMIDNLYAEPSMRATAKTFFIRSILLIALIRDGRPVGMMSIDNPGKQCSFSPTQRQLAHAIAQQATIAIDNAQLYQQAQAEHKRVEALIGRSQSIYQVAKAVNSGEPLPSVLHIALEHLIHHLEADDGFIALLEEESLYIVTAISMHQENLDRASSFPQPHLSDLLHVKRAATEKVPIFVVVEETEGLERRWYQHLRLQNVLVVPLLLGARSSIKQETPEERCADAMDCIGFIFATYSQRTYCPSPEHFTFAQDIATQCALAIEKERILTEAHHSAALATERANTLNAVFEAMHEGITVLNLDGQVVISNKTASDFLGIPLPTKVHLSSFLSQYPTYTLQGQPIEEENFPLSRALRGEPIRGERFVTRRADDAERVVEVNVAPLLNSEGQKIGVVSALGDVTEQVRVERRLRRALDTMLHAVEAVSGVTDTRTILHNVLKTALHTLSSSHGVLHLYHEHAQTFTPQLSMSCATEAATHWFDEQPKEYEVARYAQLRTKLLSGRAILVRAEECPYHPGVSPHTMLLAVPLIHHDRFLGIMTLDRAGDYGSASEKQDAFEAAETQQRDFTTWDIALAESIAQIAALALDEARWYQEAATARMLEAEMRASNAFKDEFIEITAHEFRNPISVILAYTQYITRLLKRNMDPALRQSLQEFITNIENQAYQLEHIVNSLVEVIHLNKRQITLDLADIDLAELLQQAVVTHSATIASSTINCAVEPATAPYMVRGDASRLTQIIGNLLQNAIKYNLPERDITVTLRQYIDERDKHLIEVRITDRGIGIPKEAQAHLFERFYRAPNVGGGKIRGVGLGLYIVAELLRLHEGTIRVESSGVYGEGSTFIFTLPLLRRE
jgi:PAS domain S-box-containing protein